MFKILIADDERSIRKGVAVILKRDLAEEVCCLEAANGIEALELVREQNPDLIITDISMPGCSGLEFIGELKKLKNPTQVIILSGYENFEYAKQAMKLGVKDYIMKPIKKAEFLELVSEYIARIKQEWAELRDTAKRNMENSRMMYQMKQEALLSLLQCRTPEEAAVSLAKLKVFDISFSASLFFCAAVEYQVTEKNKDYIDFAAKNIIDEFFAVREGGTVVSVEYAPGIVVLIFEDSGDDSSWQENRRRLGEGGQIIRRYGKVEVSIGLGDIVYDVSLLGRSLNQALEAADTKVFGAEPVLAVYQEIPGGEPAGILPVADWVKDPVKGDPVSMANGFEQLAAAGVTRNALAALKMSYLEVCRAVNKSRNLLPAGEKRQDYLKEFYHLWSFAELKKEVKRGIEIIRVREASGASEVNNKRLIADIFEYVNQNITKDLDLNHVAEKFSRTPGYISTLFSRAADGGFNKYITNERIKIAKKLLLDSSVPIQQVGEMCGYPNAKYFSVVFKKAVGESPRQFRETYIRR